MPGIAIPSGDLWSFNAALIESVAGRLGLKGLWEELDNFDGAVIDTDLWTAYTASSGTVTLHPFMKAVLCFSGNAPNAAMLVSDNVFDEDNEFSFLAGLEADPSDPGILITDALFLFRSNVQPTTMNNATIGVDRMIAVHDMGINYVDDVDAFHSFDGSVWQAGTSSTVSYIIGQVIFRSYDDSGTMKWQILVYDIFGTLQDTTPGVAWSATRTPGVGEDIWVWAGSARTDILIASSWITKWTRWGEPDSINYSQVSPVATSPWFAIDQDTLDAVTSILLQLILEGTATIKFRVALNGDALAGSFLTPAQLLAALNGQSITDHANSMQLEAQFNSNGTDQALLLVPQTKAEADAVIPSGSQAAIEDVRNGTIYNDGALTGTAFIPAKSDTRKDTPVDDGVGTLAVVPASDVRLDVPTDDTVGNYVPAIEARHALGDSYGSNGTEFTGTKALTPFRLPVDVILEDSEILVFEGAE